MSVQNATYGTRNHRANVVLPDIVQMDLAYLCKYFARTQSDIIRDAVREFARQTRHEEAKRAAELEKIRQQA